MSKRCENCFYNDRCPCNGLCELNEDDYDAAMDELIEERRAEFREEWFQYIEENED